MLFFSAIVYFTLLHQFIRFRCQFPVLATSPPLSQTPDSRRSPGGRGSVCLVRTLRVRLSRVRTDSFPFFGPLRLTSRTISSLSLLVLGSSQSSECSPSDLLSAGVRLDDDTLSITPFRNSAQWYCTTDLDAIALQIKKCIPVFGREWAGTRPAPSRLAGGEGSWLPGAALDRRHTVGEACCRRGGVAGAEPPHKGGPNRPDRPKERGKREED